MKNDMTTESIFPPKDELRTRWQRLQTLMGDRGLDGVLIFQNADLLYVCGTTQAEAVFLPQSGDPLVMGRPPWERLSSDAPWARIVPMPRGRGLADAIREHAPGPMRVLGLEFDVLPVAWFRRLEQGGLAGLETADASPVIREARSVKTDFEVVQIEQAARATDDLHRVIPGILSQGVSELELEGRLVGLARANGHQGLIRCRNFNMEHFLGHLVSGANGLVPSKIGSPTGGEGVVPGLSHGAGHRAIGPGDLVSVDLSGTHGGYIADMTRLYHVGDVPPRVMDQYERLLGLVEALNGHIRPGAVCGDLYDLSFELAGQLGLSRGYMTLNGHTCPFIGHGVGLELDEWPALAKGSPVELRAGMVYALEPRIFMDGVGVIGIEDTWLLTGDGPRPLTFTNRDIVVAHPEARGKKGDHDEL